MFGRRGKFEIRFGGEHRQQGKAVETGSELDASESVGHGFDLLTSSLVGEIEKVSVNEGVVFGVLGIAN